MATIGEISSIAIGGMIFLNGSRYGSQIEAKKRPTAVSLVLGTHDIKIYMIRANEYIVINKLKTEKT